LTLQAESSFEDAYPASGNLPAREDPRDRIQVDGSEGLPIPGTLGAPPFAYVGYSSSRILTRNMVGQSLPVRKKRSLPS
jgi:hypothetical protein